DVCSSDLVRGPLRLSPHRLPGAAAPDQGEGRAAVRLRRVEPAGGAYLPRPGAPERDRGVVARRNRRRAGPCHDQGTPGGPARRGATPPPAAADAAVRSLRGRLPYGRCRGVRGLPAKLLFGALATDRPAGRGADDRG